MLIISSNKNILINYGAGCAQLARDGRQLIDLALPREIGQIITDTGVAPSIVPDVRERGIMMKLV